MAKANCRKAFSAALLDTARRDESIFAVATDSRGSVTFDSFFEAFPDRFIECGIAEQNAVGIAAGLSTTGKNVFVAGPASFLSARAFEQVKVDVAYNAANVKIIGVSAGVSYGPLGCTHTTMHDLASLRALPNITVLAPADDVQTAFLTRELAGLAGPYYMRMGRGDVERVYVENETFNIGRAKELCAGDDLTIIACGEMCAPARAAAALLRQDGLEARVLDMFTVKPLDEEAVVRACMETKCLVTVEEHSVYGGLGEAVAHIAAGLAKAPLRILGLPEEVKIGKPGELFAHYGLTAEGIAHAAATLLGGLT